jgi:hypothetical protein
MAANNQYYPSLLQIIPSPSLPEGMDVAFDIVEKFLQKVGYIDLIINPNRWGDQINYNLKLISPKPLKINLLGSSGFDFVFFPTNSGINAIPVQFYWKHKVIRYLRNFNIQNISDAPSELFEILLAITGTSLNQLITELIRVLMPSFSQIKDIVSLLNNKRQLGIDPTINTIEELILFFEDNQIDAFEELFHAVINETSIDKTWERLQTLFGNILGDFDRSMIRQLLLPEVSLSVLDIELAIYFPRKWLVPMIEQPIGSGIFIEDIDITHSSALSFTVGSLGYSTKNGFQFVNQSNFDFQKSMIGKTGFTLSVTNLKVDLSRTTNIPEATADNRPTDFIGAYITEALITLPEKWFEQDNATTLGIYARNLLVGTGGISGTIGLGAVATKVAMLSDEMTLDGGQVIQFQKAGTTVQIGDKVINKTDGKLFTDGSFELDNSGGTIKVKGGKLSNFLPANPELLFTLGKKDGSNPRKGFAIGFQSFTLEFQQNEITHSQIKGSLHLPPKFDKPNAPAGTKQTIEIEAHFEKDGDFSITASRAAGVPLRLPDVFTYTLTELEVGKDEGRVYLQTTGDLKFEGILGDFLKDSLKIKDLTIYSDGGFEIKGGSIPLPDSVRLPLGPVEIYVTAIHLGAQEQMHNGQMRQYKYFGFDGGISIDPGGVDARGDGIKFYFTVDTDAANGRPHHSFLKIESLSIDLIIPGTATKENATLILQGYLSLKETEYAGSVKFSLPKAKLAGGAAMKYNKSYPAFLIDAFVELSTGIPLGSTSLGIFGFRGLFGLRYIAAKKEGETWTDFYRRPTKGVNIHKMDTPEKTSSGGTPFSIGAGISLATIADDGKTFSSQLFLLLSIPNLILLEGRANIMGKRIGLDSTEEPQFYAVIAYSPGDSVMLGFGADFLIPKEGADKGKVLKLKASMEAAYFFKNSRAWYVNFGTKTKPIQAEIISLFDGYSYLMLSASGIEAGAGVHFAFEKKYLGGTLKASAEAYFDVWGKISFERPKQIGGGIAVGGHVDVKVLGFGFYISLDCILTVEAPKPFRVAGSAELCVVINLRIKKIQKCFNVEFVWEKDNSIDTAAISALGGKGGGLTNANPVQGFHLGSGNMYPVHYFGTIAPSISGITKVVPMDTPVEILFEKALLPAATLNARIGGFTNPAENYIEVIPPTKGDRQVSHERRLEDFTMEIWNGNAWQNYHPYTALTDDAVEQAAMQNFKSVYWQKTSNEYNKLRFPAQSPFAYTDGGQPSWYVPEEMGLTASVLGCKGKEKVKTCVQNFGRGLTFKPNTAYSKKGLTWIPKGKVATASGPLVLNAPGSVEFLFPQPVESFELRLQTNATGVFIHTYKELRDPITCQRTGFQLIASQWRTRNSFNLTTPLIVHSPGLYIGKIIVEPAHGDEQVMNQLLLDIDTLQNQIYTIPNITIQQRKDIEHQILIKQGQWQIEKSRGCNIALDPAAVEAYQEELQNELEQCETLQDQLDGLVIKLCPQTSDCCCEDHHTPPLPLAPPNSSGTTMPHTCREVTLALAKCRRNCYALEKTIAKDSILQGKGAVAKVLYDQLMQCKATLAQLEKLSEKLCSERCDCNHEKPISDSNPNSSIPQPLDLEKITTCCDAIEASSNNLQHCTELEQQLEILKQQVDNSTQTKPTGNCSTSILSLCWFTWQDYQYNVNIPGQAAINEDYNLMKSAMEKTFMPIWRPKSIFRMSVTVSDRVNNGGAQNETHYFGFKTGAPLGFYNESDIKPEIKPAVISPTNQYPPQKPMPDVPENQLKFYIDFDRSYPDANGRILYSKPIYYKNPVFNIFYKQQFAHYFFTHWANIGSSQEKYSLETFIQDPVQSFDGTKASAIKVETKIVTVSDLLGANPQDVNLMNALSNAPDNCIGTGGTLIVPPKKYTQITTKWLEPLKLYTAIFYNRDDVSKSRAEVHRYCFQTSRYENMKAQIEGYRQKDKDGNEKDAVFTLDLTLTNLQIEDMWKVIKGQTLGGTNSLLNEQYPEAFDCVWFGIMDMQPLPPAVCTEFNFVQILDVNNVKQKIALLIRSNEPINDPKISIDTLRILNAVTINIDGQDDTNCEFIVSRDGTQIFVMNTNKIFAPIGDFVVKFHYLLWNGTNYVIKETVRTQNLY